jgi:hypothetical protein
MDSYLCDYCDKMSCGDFHLPEYQQWDDLYEVLRHTYCRIEKTRLIIIKNFGYIELSSSSL